MSDSSLGPMLRTETPFLMMPAPAYDASPLIAEWAPRVQAAMEARKQEIIADAGGTMIQFGYEAAWPIMIAQVPNTLRISLDQLRDFLKDKSALDLCKLLGLGLDGQPTSGWGAKAR